jgi:hypothetical protein
MQEEYSSERIHNKSKHVLILFLLLMLRHTEGFFHGSFLSFLELLSILDLIGKN